MNLKHIAFLIICIVSPSLWLANKNREDTANRAMDILANQVGIEVGGDVDQFERWDPNQTGHGHLLNKLDGRVTDAAPLRLLLQKRLKACDVNSQQNRFVLPRNVLGKIIVRCLTSQQRDDLCNNGKEITIAASDERGRKWKLKLKKRMQASHDTGTYVLIGDWTKMVKANGWKEGDDIKIWGLPYAGREDLQRFGPDHDFRYITFVFTTTVLLN
ncbi:hypothetical protein AAC387_Pa03g2953 [Persea americana]